MVNDPSRINDSRAMKPSISKNKFWKLAKAVENLLVRKPHYIKSQTKHFLSRHCLSDKMPATRKNSKLQSELFSQPNTRHGIHAWDKDSIGNGDEGG